MGKGASPLVYIFPALAFAAVCVYFLYGALDRIGLETHETDGRITTKQFAQGSTTYNTNIVAGRAWTQSSQNPDQYMVSLELDGDVTTGGFVDKQMYESLQPGERVRVKYQRTRFSNKLMVTEVSR
jgi:hypothetical protein